MKKAVLIILFSIIQLSTASALTPIPFTPIPPGPGGFTPPSMPCITNKVIIDYSDGVPASIARISDIFLHYTESSRGYLSSSGRYELCSEFTGFDSTDGALPINSPLKFTKAVDSKPVLIKGLKLKKADAFPADEYLFETQNDDPAADLIIEGLSLSNVINGLDMDGERTILADDSTISGNGTGTCLVLQGSGHIVKNSKFHGCYEGLRIEGSNMQIGAQDETRFDVDKNEIYANNTGIHWVSGINDRFAFNKIYNNPEGSTTPSPDNAIGIDSSDIIRPDFIFKNEEAETDQKALHCTVNADNSLQSVFFQFDPAVPLTDQEMIIYKTFPRHLQVEEYFTKCTIGEDGKCPITSLPSGYGSSYDTESKECVIMPEIRVVALINGRDFTSKLTPQAPKTRGPIVALGGGGEIDILSPPISAASGEGGGRFVQFFLLIG